MLTAAIKPGYRYDRSCLWDRATLMPLWARGGQEAFAYDQSCMQLSGAAYRMPEFLHGALGDLTPDIDYACAKQPDKSIACLALHSGSLTAFKALKDALLAKAVEYNTPYQFMRLLDPNDRLTTATLAGLVGIVQHLETLKGAGYPIELPGDLRSIVGLQDTALLAAAADRVTNLVVALPTRAQLETMAAAMALPPPVTPGTPPVKHSGPSRLTTGLLVAGVVLFAASLTAFGLGGMKRRRMP